MPKSDDLLFQCGVDDLSENEIVNAVNDLNYLIDSLISNIQAITPNGHREDSKSVSGGVLHKMLDGCRLTVEDARHLVAEFFLRDLIISLLHVHFFSGDFFFAVGSGSLRESLEHLMEAFESGGMSFPS